MRELWARLERSSRVALIAGVALALATIPLTALLSLVVGLACCAILGYLYPDDATKVAIYAAAPILTMAFLVGLIRGFGAIVLLVFLGCSLILPVVVSRAGAAVRTGSR